MTKYDETVMNDNNNITSVISHLVPKDHFMMYIILLCVIVGVALWYFSEEVGNDDINVENMHNGSRKKRGKKKKQKDMMRRSILKNSDNIKKKNNKTKKRVTWSDPLIF